jgi:hypothetical protein
MNVVDRCANPECGKPLLYLREGSVYCFEEVDLGNGSGDPSGHRLNHYWLCGECSANHLLERTTDEHILLTSKPSLHFIRRRAAITGRMPLPRYLASGQSS